jgi:hypothetical protein
MNDRERGISLTALLLVFVAVFPIPSQAQCSGVIAGLVVIGNVTGTSSQVDVRLTVTGSDASRGLERELEIQHVVRDSQGRLRTDTVGGKFRVDNGAGAGPKKSSITSPFATPWAGGGLTSIRSTKSPRSTKWMPTRVTSGRVQPTPNPVTFVTGNCASAST